MNRIKCLEALLATLLLCSFLQAKTEDEGSKFSLNSPYHTVQTHLHYLDSETYRAELAGKTMGIRDTSKAKELAIKLKQYLDAKGLWVNLDELPMEGDYKDTSSGDHKYVLFEDYPRIYVSKADDGKWYYSETTVEAIPELHKKAFPFGTDKLLGMVPMIGQKEFLGLAIWQYIGIIILLVLAFFLFKLFYWIFNILVFRGIRTVFDTEEASKHVRALSKFISVLIVLLLANLLIPTLQLPVEVSYFLFLLIKILAPLAGIVILYSVVDILGDYMKFKALETRSTLDDQVVPIIRKTLKGFIIVIGVLFILQNLNFNITALLAGLSIGGLAIALAAQQTLKDFLGSLMIFIDQPFKVGDYIISNEVEGIVEAVGFRSSRIRTFERSLIVIPNGKLSDMAIDNMGMRYQRRLYANTAITYDTPPALIETFREGVEKIVLDHPMINNNEYHIRFNEMGGHYLNIMIWAYFDTQVWDEELKYREEIYLQIMRLAESLGVRFAFPTSTIHVEEFPGQGSLTPRYGDESSSFRQKLNNFFNQK